VEVINRQGVTERPETPEAVVCDGIVVVAKDATLPDGWALEGSRIEL